MNIFWLKDIEIIFIGIKNFILSYIRTRVLPINCPVEPSLYIPRKLTLDLASVTYTSHAVNREIQLIFAKCEYNLLLLDVINQYSEFEQKKSPEIISE